VSYLLPLLLRRLLLRRLLLRPLRFLLCRLRSLLRRPPLPPSLPTPQLCARLLLWLPQAARARCSGCRQRYSLRHRHTATSG